uniref:D-glycero-beta-D-manno-heptose 1-phosphate adenylyltransferase n=1 Tax=Streptomyces sp. F8 TaxID=1436085 RepID=UPI0003D8B73D|nr:D-glycero-beta-D-manno-heptose 1-phosphate adenylyltransferase [Streptomyces sp. F8]AHE40001.1 RfaE bifunctional protein [Streptomyces sp. F8]
MTRSGRAHIQALTAALPLLDTNRLHAWGRLLADKLPTGGRLLVAGNGGSAAEAQHLTSELVGRYRAERAPLSAIALHADTSSLTAITNDYGPHEVFARQVRAHGRPGDILLLLSTSGTSPNVLAAAHAGRQLGLTVWALTGPAPNPLADASDQAVCVDAPEVATVQECHLVAVHLLCAAVDTHLTAPAPAAGAEQTDAPRLVVVGDVLLDRDITGSADRLSPEAPAPVLAAARSTERPGGAGLAAVLAARTPGWQVTLICGIGQDQSGAHLRALLDDAGVEVIDLATSGTTPVKTRVRAADRTLLRFDTDAGPLPLGPLPDAARTRLAEAAAVLVCDYGRGITSHDDLRQALTAAAGDRPLVWDPHPKGTAPTPGTALAVPNTDEALHFTGHDGPRDLAGDTARAVQLLAAWPVKQVAVTRGRDGAVLVADANGHPLAVPARPAAGDTCGAGDQLAVTAALTLTAGRLPSHAIAAAVDAATDYVNAGGPAAPATAHTSDTTGPLELAARVRAQGGRVVGAGGCFDLLHAGHLSLLDQARRLGDVLIVCINSDTSVRRLKGADRPVVGERERATLLNALDCVDDVLVFAEDTPEKVLAELRPDIWVKGGDYAGRRIAEADLVESWGGEVVTVPFLEGHSTTTRLQHLAQQAGAR